MKISVVTATYNRANLLPKLFNSLCKNYKTYKDFEWVIIDDGSKDNTKEIVKKWKNEVDFDIKYHYQENAGKMNAINGVMRYVSGDIIIEIDSDDYLTDGALKMVNDDYEKLDNDNVYGIIYKRDIVNKDTSIKNDLDGKVIKLFDFYNVLGYDFDLALTFKASERKKYIYQLEHNEKFITESRTYYRMDQFYDGMLFRDKYIIKCEYMEDGYSKNINKTFKKYPYGYYQYFKECLSYCKKVLFKKRIYFVKHYILFSYLIGLKKMEAIKGVNGLNKLLVMLLIIPGYMKSKRF